jgi:hypothetical protein
VVCGCDESTPLFSSQLTFVWRGTPYWDFFLAPVSARNLRLDGAEYIWFHKTKMGETPHSTRKVAQLILQSLVTEDSSQMEGRHLSRQRQMNEASVNILKKLFLENRAGRSDAKSGFGWTMPTSAVAKEFINRGN